MAKGKYPRLTTNREKIYQMTGQIIPLTRTRKDGTEYIVKVTPRCVDCKGIPVNKLYRIRSHYRKERVKRNEHRAYECPKCRTLFPRTIVEQKAEVFSGDRNG